MRTSETLLLDFIRQSPQFRIPVNQRRFAWTQRECRQLWEDNRETRVPSCSRRRSTRPDRAIPTLRSGNGSAARPTSRMFAFTTSAIRLPATR